jgi:hypothetical protein
MLTNFVGQIHYSHHDNHDFPTVVMAVMIISSYPLCLKEINPNLPSNRFASQD